MLNLVVARALTLLGPLWLRGAAFVGHSDEVEVKNAPGRDHEAAPGQWLRRPGLQRQQTAPPLEQREERLAVLADEDDGEQRRAVVGAALARPARSHRLRTRQVTRRQSILSTTALRGLLPLDLEQPGNDFDKEEIPIRSSEGIRVSDLE